MKNEIFFVHKRDIFLCYNYSKMLRTKDACELLRALHFCKSVLASL